MAGSASHHEGGAPTRWTSTRARSSPGGFLLIQAPNAVALHKRIEMLSGRNPYIDLTTTTRDSPPAFRAGLSITFQRPV